MNEMGVGPRGSAMIERVKAILLNPKAEWPRIDAEPATIGDIYRSWVLPLAAIGPVANFIGSLVFGYGAFGISYRPSIVEALVTALISYGLTLVGVYLLAMVIDALAPSFGAIKNRTSAFKVAAYSATAAWVAGIFGLIPALSFLGLLGLYSLYLLWLGLPVLMKAPADKATSYTAVTVVAMIVVGILISVITAPIVALVSPGPGSGALSGSVAVPGGGTIDMGELERAGKRMEQAATDMENGTSKPAIGASVLQSLLPASVAGLARTSIESGSAGAAGVGGSNAQARYGNDDNEVTLSITDMGAMGGLAALGSALNVESSRQDQTSYEKTGKVDGRMTTERYDSSDRSGSYGMLVGDRIMVQAEGRVPSIDILKGAVAGVDISRLESLARE